MVLPLPGIRPVRLHATAPVSGHRPREVEAQRIGRWERLRGYGRHFFEVTEYSSLDLSRRFRQSATGLHRVAVGSSAWPLPSDIRRQFLRSPLRKRLLQMLQKRRHPRAEQPA